MEDWESVLAEAEAKEKDIARRQAKRDAPPLIDLSGVLAGAGEIGADPAKAGRGFVEQMRSPSVLLGTTASLATTAVTGNPLLGAAAGGGAAAIGSLLETNSKAFPTVAEVNHAVGVGGTFAAFDALFFKLGGARSAVKNKLLRGAKPGELPKGGLYGRLIDGMEEAHAFGRQAAFEVDQLINSGMLDGRGLTREELKRHMESTFMPAQMLEGELLDQAQALGEGSTAGGALRRHKESVERLARAYGDAWKQSLGDLVDDPQKLTALAGRATKDVLSRRHEAVSALHDRVMATVGSDSLEGPTILRTMSDVEASVANWKRLQGAPDPETIGRVTTNAEKIIQTVRDRNLHNLNITRSPLGGRGLRGGTKSHGGPATMPQPQMTVLEARQMRTLFREARAGMPKEARTAAADSLKVEKALTELIEGHLQKVDTARGLTGSDSLVKTWKAGNKASRAEALEAKRLKMTNWVDLIDEGKRGAEAIKGIAPDTMSPRNVALLRRNVGGAGSETWHKIQRFKAEEFYNKYINTKNLNFAGMIDDLTLVKNSKGPNTIRAILGPKHVDKLLQFAKFGRAQQGGTAVKQKVGIHILENGAYIGGPIGVAAGTVSGQQAAAAAATVFIGPRVLVKWLMNPKRVDFLLTGMNPNTNFTAAARAVNRLTAQAMAEASMDDMQPAHAKMRGNEDVTFINPSQTPGEYAELSRFLYGDRANGRGPLRGEIVYDRPVR